MEELKEEKKLTYDQLKEIAGQLSMQVNRLKAELQNSNISNMLNRLGFLFKVLENSDKFNKEFVTKCSKEIVDMMTIPEEQEEEK